MATLTLFHVLVFSMLGLLRSQVPYIWTTPPLDISMDHSLTSFKPRCHYLLISEVFLITLLWGKLSVQFSLVAQSCLTLCNPMDCSTPGFPVPFPKVFSNSCPLSQLSNHLILYYPLLLLPSIFPSMRVFPVSLLFTSGDQSIGASASASVLPMNIQD